MPSSGFVETGSNVRNRPKEIIGLYCKINKKRDCPQAISFYILSKEMSFHHSFIFGTQFINFPDYRFKPGSKVSFKIDLRFVAEL